MLSHPLPTLPVSTIVRRKGGLGDLCASEAARARPLAMHHAMDDGLLCMQLSLASLPLGSKIQVAQTCT